MSTAATTPSGPTSDRARPSSVLPPPRVTWLATALVILLAGCTPAELEQPTSGDGWRLLGASRGGEPMAPQIGDAANQAIADMGLLRMDGTTAPLDPDSEIALVLTHVVSGSCPQVRFDGLRVDEASRVVEGRFTDIADLFYVGSCTADANPVVYWIAVERDLLPAGRVTITTNKAPAVQTLVDL